MAVINEIVFAFAVMYPLLGSPASAGSIADIEHVVLFMQGAIYHRSKCVPFAYDA